MKPHHILVYIFMPAIVAGMAIWLAVAHQVRLGRIAEHQALEQQWQQMTELAAQNEHLSKLLALASTAKPLPNDQLMELLRLRGQVGVLHRQQTDLDQVRKENQQIHVALAKYLERLTETNTKATADYWPENSWTNTGYASPEAALQTALWAGSTGDMTNLLASLTEDMQTNVLSEYKGKSAMETSVRLADETADVQSIQILSRDVLDDNNVSLTVGMEGQDKFQTVKMLMSRIGGEWKLGAPQPGP